MNKKIKVIELTNKIYANLDVPEKVKYADKKYEYSKTIQDYKSEDGEWLFQRMLTFYGRWLEREVEILDDEEEIDIQDIEELKNTETVYDVTLECEHEVNKTISNVDISKKINEILRAVKQLEKKINKEE